MDNQHKAIELVIGLVAKTGLYFSCVDGNYDESERRFIDNYIGQLAAVGDVSEVKAMLDNAIDKHYTHDEIVADTKALLATFESADDRRAVLLSLYNFIDNVIKADGVEHPAEREALLRWLEALK